MRELYVVAVSDDGRSLVLATSPDATRGGFRLALDDRLQAALRGELPGRGRVAGAGEDRLTPREIQARLRAGESSEDIARDGRVPITRIERFSGPVVSERDRVLDQARAARLSRPRAGASALPLGDAVETALGATAHLRRDSVEWSTRRREDGVWVVRLTYVARGRAKAAEWTWDPTAREVTALDRQAALLGHADTASARKQSQSSSPKPASSASSTKTAKSGTAKSGTAKSGTAKSAKSGKTAKSGTGRKTASSPRPPTKKQRPPAR